MAFGGGVAVRFSVVKLSTGTNDTFCVCASREGEILTGHESVVKVWTESCDDWTQTNLLETNIEGDVNYICQFPKCDCRFVVAVNRHLLIYCIDSSRPSKPVKQFSVDEEINHIDVHSSESYICAGDDSGSITVIDLCNESLLRTLGGKHTSICTAVRFHPRKPWELVSGGLDCNLVRWDFNCGRPLCTLSTQALTENLLINPPMVHCIDVLASKYCVACGLGNGSVVVYSLKSPKKMELKCIATLHMSIVGCICTIEYCADQIIVSGGNDGKICVIKVCDSASKPSSFEIQILAEIEHGSKINWIAVSPDKSSIVVFVADVTSFVSRYVMKFT